MSKNMIQNIGSQNHFLQVLVIFLFSSSFLCRCSLYNSRNFSNVSKFPYASDLKPYQWRYIRVDLPQWFSSMTFSLESNVNLNPQGLEKVDKERLPVVCLREGGLPLPDINNDITGLVYEPLSNVLFEHVQGLQKAELCYPMQKNINLRLTNEQILPGVWYFGFFNGIGPTRTQAKMIDRGKSYSFTANISIDQCPFLKLGGPNCDLLINHLTCANKHVLATEPLDSVLTGKIKNVKTCRDPEGNKCLINGEPKVYALDVQEITEQLVMEVKNVEYKGADVYLKCYARYSAISSTKVHDFSANIGEGPLTIPSPKVGLWYISIYLVNRSNNDDGFWDTNGRGACFSLEWQIFQCPGGKVGLNCTFYIYMLQTIPGNETLAPYGVNYKPKDLKISSHSPDFPLDPFFTHQKSDFAWNYFVVDVPHAASGGNLHVKLVSCDSNINYQVYARYKGLPSLDSWDYFYENSTSNSHGSMSFKLYDSNEKVVSFHFLYVREGTWIIGLRQVNPVKTISRNQTMALISIERCPKGCSNYGRCKSRYDISGSLQYNYCSCDEDHGGFDCGVVIVSRLGRFLKQEVVKKRAGHIWRSVFLVGSNAAAFLPAMWCLRQKAFAEWVIFMSSGISSGIYHACDAGNPCLLSPKVLQFMDFWLSFMAVVSTFVCLTNFREAIKGAIHVGVAISTALLARNGAIEMSNVVIVIAIGAVGLLLGLLIEFVFRFRSYPFPSEYFADVTNRWQEVKGWLRNLLKTFARRFHWGFLVAAFICLGMAKFCWDFETPENYWIWHSLWHTAAYTSSFLFLCSKAILVNSELTPQHSAPSEG